MKNEIYESCNSDLDDFMEEMIISDLRLFGPPPELKNAAL